MERRIYTTGQRLSLAEYLDDVDDPAGYEDWLDPDTQSGYNYHFTDTYDEYHGAESSSHRFEAVIIRNADEKVIGSVSLSPEGTLPDLAIRIYLPYRAAGYGTEAFRLALEYCFAVLGFELIYAGCYEHNTASSRMLKSLGFIPYPEGNCPETHYLTGEPIVQLDFVKYRD